MFLTYIPPSLLLLLCLQVLSVHSLPDATLSRIDPLSIRSRSNSNRYPPPQPHHLREVRDLSGNPIPPYNTVYYFDQLIDHDNPALGTFKQRYWHTWEYYQTGGPIMLQTPGESNAKDSFVTLTNTSIQGLMAQAFNGATISIEHRFFGMSNPYPNLNTTSLKLHTIDQAINDLVYFAQNVKLPMPEGDTDAIRPDKVPWVLFGGSYPGALTAWTMNKKPGVFWAGYSSSGVVQPIADFWRYFEPIRENMPKNCSADVQNVITFVDKVLNQNDPTLVQQLQSTLGFEGISNLNTFLNALKMPLLSWQNLQPASNSQSYFYSFCDTLEVVNGQVASEEGWGVEVALEAWGFFNHQFLIPNACQRFTNINTCLSIYDDPRLRDVTIDNEDRSWYWLTCNEMGWSQNGCPSDKPDQPAIVSRHLTADYFESQCQHFFDDAFAGSSLASRVNETSKKYLGWSVEVDRLFVANGKRDPWLAATLSAPSQNIQSTDLRPIALSEGFHCSDMLTENGFYDSSIADLQIQALSSMKSWLAEFKQGNASSSAKATPETTGGQQNGAKRAQQLSSMILILVLHVITMLL